MRRARRPKSCTGCKGSPRLVPRRWRRMSALSARNPMRSDPRADCVAGKSPGFPRRRSGESKWIGRPVRQHAQTADHYLVQAYQPGRKCSQGAGRACRTRESRRCATQWDPDHEAARERWYEVPKRAQHKAGQGSQAHEADQWRLKRKDNHSATLLFLGTMCGKPPEVTLRACMFEHEGPLLRPAQDQPL